MGRWAGPAPVALLGSLGRQARVAANSTLRMARRQAVLYEVLYLPTFIHLHAVPSRAACTTGTHTCLGLAADTRVPPPAAALPLPSPACAYSPSLRSISRSAVQLILGGMRAASWR